MSEWTTFHQALGIEPRPLVYADLKQAIADQVTESESLDWKRQYDLRRSDNSDGGALEIAKDIAAMANGAGGTIVYGVGEDRKTSAAADLHPVDLGDTVTRQLRQQMASCIRPLPIYDVIDLPADPENPGQGALVVSVPASSAAPHFVYSGLDPARFRGAPYRHGAQTQWMSEPEIEVAYRRRFAGDAALQDRLVEMTRRLPRPRRRVEPQLLLAAVPIRSGRRATVDRNEYQSITRAVVELLRDVPLFSRVDGSVSEGLPLVGLRLRRGLRRWQTISTGEHGTFFQSYLELHDDGAIAGRIQAASRPEDGVLHVETNYYEQAALELALLAREATKFLRTDGHYLVHVDLDLNDRVETNKALALGKQVRDGCASRRFSKWGVAATHVLEDFEPVTIEGDVRTFISTLAFAREIAQAIYEQFGLTNDQVIPPNGHIDPRLLAL